MRTFDWGSKCLVWFGRSDRAKLKTSSIRGTFCLNVKCNIVAHAMYMFWTYRSKVNKALKKHLVYCTTVIIYILLLYIVKEVTILTYLSVVCYSVQIRVWDLTEMAA